MRRLWSRWVALMGVEERGTTLALFRVAVASVMLFTLITIIEGGVVDALWVDRADGGIRDVALGPIVGWLGGGPRAVWSLTVVACVLSLAMALGLGGRWMILAAGLAYRSVSSIGYASGGYDSMIANALWLLFLGSSTATLSLDCRLRTGRWQSEASISAWPRMLAIFQLVVIYTATGLQKTGVSWTFADDYSALYWFSQDPTWTRFDMSYAADVYWVTQVSTCLVWHFEVFAPLLLLVLYFQRTADRPGRLRRLFNRFDLRKPWVAFGVSMHLGIALLLEMGPFSWIALAYYLCLRQPPPPQPCERGREKEELTGQSSWCMRLWGERKYWLGE